MRAPSFLVFVTDQLRADHLGCYGNRVVRTPALDALAADSVVFDRAYVASPVCMPNRATIATGRWPSAHGTRTNGITLDRDAQTFMGRLREDGWTTAAVGKLHFQPMGWPFEPFQLDEIERGTPRLLDPLTPDAAPRPREAGWDRWEEAARHRAEFLPLPAGYYGFDHVDLLVGHGDTLTGHYTHWARRLGTDPDELSGYARATARDPDWDQTYRTELPEELYPSTFVAVKTIERLERLAGGNEPFLVFCSFPDPHHPFTPPGRFWEMHDPSAVGLPASFDDDHDASPPHVRAIAAARGRPGEDPTMTWAPTEAQLRRAMAAEYGTVALIDECVGRVLDALDRLGLAERTNVLFTADHGDLFGDHGLLLKHLVHYDGVMRVPLIARLPDLGRPGSRIDALVSSADLAPSILDLAGVDPFRGIQGQSLRGLLEGRAERLRDALLVEEDQPFGLPGLAGPVRMRTVVTEDARLTVYAERKFGELYDRGRDPDELENLWDVPEAGELRQRLHRQLVAAMIHADDAGVRPVAGA